MTTHTSGAADLPEALLRSIQRFEVVDCIDDKHVPAVIPKPHGPWVRYEDHIAALAAGQATAAPVRGVVQDDLITLRKPATRAEMMWLLKLAHLVISDVNKTLDDAFAPAQPVAEPAKSAPQPSPTPHGQVPVVQWDALSDAVRVPLNSLHADAAYLIGRLRDGSMPYARVIEIIRERIDAASPTAQAAPAAGAVAGPDDYTPLLDDEGRMMVGTSHHYTAENIRALVAEYKALEAGGPDTWELHYNTDHRARAGVLWRVISALADEVPFAAAAQAAESVPAPPPPPECKTEAEKRAFAFGWFKALESERMKAESVQEDAARYRFIRDVPYSDDVRSVLVHQQNAAMDRVIDAARKQGENHDNS